jgi:intracellular multiplication protein IcmL
MSKTKKTQESKDDLNDLELHILTSRERLKAVIQSHTALIKIAVMLTYITAALVTISLIFVVKMEPKNQYFASSNDGRIVKLVPMNRPLMSLQGVENFAAKAISNTFTFDYANYQKQMTANANSFTNTAFSDIKKALQGNDGIISETLKNNWVVTANVMAAPQVVKQGEIGKTGIYGWRLIYPVTMTFQNEHDTRSSRYTVDVVVVRVNQKNHPRGVAIQKLTLTPYRY